MVTKPKKTVIQVRIDESIKNQAANVLNNLGMDTSTAINVFLRQVIAEQGLPFQPKLTTFNDETLAAVKEADEMVKTKSGNTYASVDELFADSFEE